MLNLKEIKKRIPDAAKQQIVVDESCTADYEEKTKWLCEQMETGCIGYTDKPHGDKSVTLTVYTSVRFGKFLKSLKPGTKCRNRLGREFSIEGEPFIQNHYTCVRANGDTWYCDVVYDKDCEYTEGE